MLSFTPAGSYAAAANLSAIVAADFNNDGKLDLASAGGFSATRVGVRLGDGAGGFGAAQEYVFGWGYPTSIAAADFNNDSKLDIVVTDLSGCSILMGNGDGTFQAAVEAASGDGVHVAVGHFNNDSNLDLVVGGHHWDFGLYYQPYLGNGEGGFAAGPIEYIGGDPYWGDRLAAVELNNDGKLDVVIGDGRALLGNGNGTLQYDYGQPVLLSSGAIASGDFTGDLYADVIVSGNSVAVLRSRGDGSFEAPIRTSTNGIVHSGVATADLNGDGKLDAVVTDRDTSTVSVLLGNGDGPLRYAGAFATGTAPSEAAIGDFNGDGRPDVATSNSGSNNISVLFNNGDWPPALLGDYNQDGIVDAADYVVWRKSQGTTVAKYTGADGSGNGVVDQDDYGVWRAHVGQMLPPAISISDATVTEGNTGTVSATFTLTLGYASAVDVMVNFSTVSDTAYAADYTTASGTVTIPAGETSRTFAVAVLGDRIPESAEHFAVYLRAPTNVRIGDSQGIGTILDNEPRISINDVSKSEGMSGKTLFTFTVTLSAAYDQNVIVSYRTLNGSATTSDNDYTAKTGTLSFAPGETTKTITIEVKGDNKKEADEAFILELFSNSANSLITRFYGVGTIWNDDN
jgi:hypothetical protein